MRKVNYAKLHVGYFLPGIKNADLGTTLDPGNKHRGMELTWAPEGLYGTYSGVSFVIPASNIIGCSFVAEDKPKVASNEQAPAKASATRS